MSSITVTNVPDKNVVRPEERIKLSALLTEIGREAGGVDIHIERDMTPAEPMSFE
jgi:hypothetical protein